MPNEWIYSENMCVNDNKIISMIIGMVYYTIQYAYVKIRKH